MRSRAGRAVDLVRSAASGAPGAAVTGATRAYRRAERAVPGFLAALRHRHPVLAAAAAVLVLVAAVGAWRAANGYVNPRTPEHHTALLATAAQIFGGAILLVGLYFTGRNLQVNREGQITERFTRAIDQLGSDRLAVRLGAIYALERIARDSATDHAPIVEVLTAYVRENARVDPGRREAWREEEDGAAVGTPGATKRPERRAPADVQAALTVLARRRRTPDRGEPLRVNLEGSDLRHAELSRGDWRGVDLSGCDLESAWLTGADLSGALLLGANLRDAALPAAKLRGAYLTDSILIHAHLSNADLVGANLHGARLERAFLADARMDGVSFARSRLDGANFFRARLARASFRDARVGNAGFAEADLAHAELRGADLRQARELTREQLAQAGPGVDASTLLPPYLLPTAESDHAEACPPRA